MANKTTPPQEEVHDLPTRPEWVEPDPAIVGTLTAMKSVLDQARYDALWVYQMERAGALDPVLAPLAKAAPLIFFLTIRIILDRWRCYFPDDAPPKLPKQVRDSDDAFRAVDKAMRRLDKVNKRVELEIAKAREFTRQALVSAPSPRLTVDLPSKTLTLDGVIHDVGSERALRWVKVLADRAGDWISSTDLNKLDRDLCSERTDKYKSALPKAVLDLIKSKTGAGSRLILA